MKVIKLSYSREPWRLVTTEGKEVAVRQVFDHPDLGCTVIDGAVSGATKVACTDKALVLLESLLRKQGNPT